MTAVHERSFISYLGRACGLARERVGLPVRVPDAQRGATAQGALRSGGLLLHRHVHADRTGTRTWRRAGGGLHPDGGGGDALPGGDSPMRSSGRRATTRSVGSSEASAISTTPAVAAHYLSADGKVAILDVDYHHGNGQQDIFYERSDVLTVSIHGDPSFAYPYFSGFADETGVGPGRATT